MSISLIQDEAPSLPPNFMQTVVQLQTQLECDGSLEVVQQLNVLYATAMEYYIHHDLRKLSHFHRKLTSLLTRNTPFKPIIIENSGQGKQEDSYSRKLQSEMRKFNSQGMILVQSMLEGSELKATSSKRVMIENISTQEAVLQQRMMQRGKSKSTSTSSSLRA